MILAQVLPSILGYFIIAAIVAKGLYRVVEWSTYDSNTEHQVYAFMWSLIWPISGMFLMVRLYMTAPTLAEARRAKQEKAAIEAKHKVHQRIADLEKSEQELAEVTEKLKRMGINV